MGEEGRRNLGTDSEEVDSRYESWELFLDLRDEITVDKGISRCWEMNGEGSLEREEIGLVSILFSSATFSSAFTHFSGKCLFM
jgi:hypothetical protein